MFSGAGLVTSRDVATLRLDGRHNTQMPLGKPDCSRVSLYPGSFLPPCGWDLDPPEPSSTHGIRHYSDAQHNGAGAATELGLYLSAFTVVRDVRELIWHSSKSMSAAVASAWSSWTFFRSDDGQRDYRLGQQPCEACLVRGQPQIEAEAVHSTRGCHFRLANPWTGEALVTGDLALQEAQISKQSSMEGCVGNDREPELCIRGTSSQFRPAVDEVVFHLCRDGGACRRRSSAIHKACASCQTGQLDSSDF